MSKSTWRSIPCTFALLLVILCLSVQVAPAQGGKSGAAVDIMDLLKRHDDAMNQQDLNAVLALFASDAKTVVLGTGPGERYQGIGEIKTAYTEFFKDYDKGTLARECYWKDGGGSGNMAWGAAMCKFTDSMGDRKREYGLNVSTVVEKRSGKWQFVMVHFSNLTGAATQ